MSENMRRELTQKLQDRTTLVEKAESLLKDGKREEYRAEMDKVRNLNGEIEDLKSLIEEQDRKFMEKAIDPAEERDKAAERGNDPVSYTHLDVYKRQGRARMPLRTS